MYKQHMMQNVQEVVKTIAHRSLAEARSANDEFFFLGNDQADSLAKQAALSGGPPKLTVQMYGQEYKEQRQHLFALGKVLGAYKDLGPRLDELERSARHALGPKRRPRTQHAFAWSHEHDMYICH